MKPVADSKSAAWLVAVFDLSEKCFKSFHKKSIKHITRILDLNSEYKTMIFQTLKKGVPMMPSPDDIRQALAELEELYPIEAYEDAIRIIRTKDADDLLVYADDISGFRTETLHVLIQAGLLDETQISRIKKVDGFIASHNVPRRLQPLQDWLKANALP